MKITEHEKQMVVEKDRKNIAAIAGATDADAGCQPDTQGLHYPDIYMTAYAQRKAVLTRQGVYKQVLGPKRPPRGGATNKGAGKMKEKYIVRKCPNDSLWYAMGYDGKYYITISDGYKNKDEADRYAKRQPLIDSAATFEMYKTV